jgi:hypothetical protein
MVWDWIRDLVHCDGALGEQITDGTALAANLAAISLAIFVVLPTFHAIVRIQRAPGFSERVGMRRVRRAFAAIGTASCLFTAAVVVGVAGRHLTCRLILYFQEAATVAGALLFFVAIYLIWRSATSSLGDPDPTR